MLQEGVLNGVCVSQVINFRLKWLNMPLRKLLTQNVSHNSGLTLWALLDSLPVPMVAHNLGDPEAVIFINESFSRGFGYTVAELPNLNVLIENLFPDPGYRAEAIIRWQNEVDARIQTDRVMSPCECRIFDKAGRERDVSIAFAVQDSVVIMTFQDLTEKDTAVAVFKADWRRKQHSVFPIAEILPTDAHLNARHVVPDRFKFGNGRKDVLRMHEAAYEDIADDVKPVLSRGLYDRGQRLLRMNSEAFNRRAPYSGGAQAASSDVTTPDHAAAVLRTFGEGSLSPQRLAADPPGQRRISKKLQTVLDAAQGYIWRFDLWSQTITFDREWMVAQGFVTGQWRVAFSEWIERVHPDDVPTVTSLIAAMRAQSVERLSAEYRQRFSDGSLRWIQTHLGISARDEKGRPVELSGMNFDITDEMAERMKALEKQGQGRNEFQSSGQQDKYAQSAGGVAHDLNNLIAVVGGTVEMLEVQANGQSALLDGLGRIRRSVGMARDLIAGLGGPFGPDLPRGTHDIGKLLRDAVDLLGYRRIKRHAVAIELGEGHVTVWANPTEFQRVLVNLTINGCDSGTPERPAKVRLTSLPAGTEAPRRVPDAGVYPPDTVPVTLFSISDTGSGLSDEVRSRMFRPHFSTKGTAGSGLGMSIVAAILQSNRAALWVDSTKGQGTTMTVAWPSKNPATPVGATTEEIGLTDILRGKHILVVDERPDMADALADTLEAAGGVAVAVSDMDEAAQLLSEAPHVWSAVVMDPHLAEQEYLSLGHLSGRLSPAIPVVLVTDHPDRFHDALKTEFAAVLSKPVSAVQLTQAVHKCLQ